MKTFYPLSAVLCLLVACNSDPLTEGLHLDEEMVISPSATSSTPSVKLFDAKNGAKVIPAFEYVEQFFRNHAHSPSAVDPATFFIKSSSGSTSLSGFLSSNLYDNLTALQRSELYFKTLFRGGEQKINVSLEKRDEHYVGASSYSYKSEDFYIRTRPRGKDRPYSIHNRTPHPKRGLLFSYDDVYGGPYDPDKYYCSRVSIANEGELNPDTSEYVWWNIEPESSDSHDDGVFITSIYGKAWHIFTWRGYWLYADKPEYRDCFKIWTEGEWKIQGIAYDKAAGEYIQNCGEVSVLTNNYTNSSRLPVSYEMEFSGNIPEVSLFCEVSKGLNYKRSNSSLRFIRPNIVNGSLKVDGFPYRTAEDTKYDPVIGTTEISDILTYAQDRTVSTPMSANKILLNVPARTTIEVTYKRTAYLVGVNYTADIKSGYGLICRVFGTWIGTRLIDEGFEPEFKLTNLDSGDVTIMSMPKAKTMKLTK